MNNTYTYIADNNNTDMFNIEIPAFDAGSEIPSPPVSSQQVPASSQSEFQSFASKSFTSFGTMIICIVLFFVIVLIIKKKKHPVETEFETAAEAEYISKQQTSNDIPESVPVVQEQKKSFNLNTPSSVHKCILSFLENTKEK